MNMRGMLTGNTSHDGRASPPSACRGSLRLHLDASGATRAEQHGRSLPISATRFPPSPRAIARTGPVLRPASDRPAIVTAAHSLQARPPSRTCGSATSRPHAVHAPLSAWATRSRCQARRDAHPRRCVKKCRTWWADLARDMPQPRDALDRCPTRCTSLFNSPVFCVLPVGGDE